MNVFQLTSQKLEAEVIFHIKLNAFGKKSAPTTMFIKICEQVKLKKDFKIILKDFCDISLLKMTNLIYKLNIY